MKNLLIVVLCLSVSVVVAQPDRDAYFADRPTTPGPDVESFKENVPVKKESFTAKLERLKKEGFKVAVVMVSNPIRTKPANPTATSSSTTTQLTLKGKLPSIESECNGLVENFTAQMNDAFNTDIFEIPDMKKIPYREVRIGKVDDWEVTKYRMVLSYSVSPSYDYNLSMGKYYADFIVGLNVTATEYVNEKKGVKMRYPIRAGNLGTFKVAYESETELGVETIEELHAIVNPPMGSELLAELQKLQDENMPKFIQKRKK